jgi:hypothetical protein
MYHFWKTQQEGYVVGYGLFTRTTDSGLNWMNYYPPLSSANIGYQGYVESIRITENGYIIGGMGNRLLLAERGINTGIPATEKEQGTHRMSVNPNPINGASVISVELPESTHVFLEILDTRGSHLATLADTRKPAGRFSLPFNSKEHARGLKPGTYFLILQTKDYSETCKVMIAQ